MIKEFKFSVMENLKAVENEDLEPFLQTFLEEGGMTELVQLLRLPYYYHALVEYAMRPLAEIFKYYCAHTILIENDTVIL